MATATIEERVSKLEGAHEHLATKADLADLKAELIKWMVGVMIGGMATAATLSIALLKLLEG